MAKPPKTPPSSDIDGVNKGAGATPPSKAQPDPGKPLAREHAESIGRPPRSTPGK